MADLNLELDYFDHPKTRRLVGLLGRGSEVLPLRLWCYCGKFHCADGKLTEYSEQEIENFAGWWGKKGEALAAMVKVGFLDKAPEGYAIHNWEQRQGHLNAMKLHAKHMAKTRWDKYRNSHADSNATSIADSNAPSIPSSITSLPHDMGKENGDGMNGMDDCRTVLARAGVTGPNLARLVADERLTLSMCREAIEASKSANRSRGGFITKTLMNRLGMGKGSMFGEAMPTKAAMTAEQQKRLINSMLAKEAR